MDKLGPKVLRRLADAWEKMEGWPHDTDDMRACAAAWEAEREDRAVVQRAAKITGLTADSAEQVAHLLEDEWLCGTYGDLISCLRSYAELAREDKHG